MNINTKPENLKQDMATFFKALGHPIRLQIIEGLQKQGTCFAGNIADQLPVAASTASQHLKILKEAGVITGTIDGPHRCYCIRKEAFQEMQEWFEKR
jgi:ArsR family transcriptional regulator